jgi:hypothetical protein
LTENTTKRVMHTVSARRAREMLAGWRWVTDWSGGGDACCTTAPPPTPPPPLPPLSQHRHPLETSRSDRRDAFRRARVYGSVPSELVHAEQPPAVSGASEKTKQRLASVSHGPFNPVRASVIILLFRTQHMRSCIVTHSFPPSPPPLSIGWTL